MLEHFDEIKTTLNGNNNSIISFWYFPVKENGSTTLVCYKKATNRGRDINKDWNINKSDNSISENNKIFILI